MKNPLFKAGGVPLIWDGDLNLEGVAVTFSQGNFFGTVGGFSAEERSSSDDSLLYVVQAGLKVPLGDAAKLTAGVGLFRVYRYDRQRAVLQRQRERQLGRRRWRLPLRLQEHRDLCPDSSTKGRRLAAEDLCACHAEQRSADRRYRLLQLAQSLARRRKTARWSSAGPTWIPKQTL